MRKLQLEKAQISKKDIKEKHLHPPKTAKKNAGLLKLWNFRTCIFKSQAKNGILFWILIQGLQLQDIFAEKMLQEIQDLKTPTSTHHFCQPFANLSHGPKNPGSPTFHGKSWLVNRDPYNGLL